MTRLFLTIIFAIFSIICEAKEGMWLPFLLEKLNEKDMRSMGMKITAKDIYNENKSSLKDAVCIFGSGCTGEVISNAGLVLTNHHCGYGTVQGLSSMQNDYLKNGFWAMNNAEELPCQGLSVTFIVKIVDVTNELTAGLADDVRDTTRQKEIAKRIDNLVKNNTNIKDGLGANIKGFFNDNKFFMFYTQKFNDVRLVGFPPNGIGKFGGDTDNWAWPRHTGDFSLFRIYVDANNKSTAYNKNNVPYHPKKYFKINIGGVKEGDFSWVYGFPGRTQQNLTSGGVNEVMNILDPARIKIRQAKLNIMEEDMRATRENFIKYASKQAGIANYYKKWQGELLGLQINDGVNKKLNQEQEFDLWLRSNKQYNAQYGTVVQDINAIYGKQKTQAKLNIYLDEAFGGCEGLMQGAKINEMIGQLQKTNNTDSIQKFKAGFAAFLKNYNQETDKKITIKLIDILQKEFSELNIAQDYNIGLIHDQSVLTNPQNMMAIFDKKDAAELLATLQADKGYQLFITLNNKQVENFDAFRKNQMDLIAMHHLYTQAKILKNKDVPFYPDANSTLRVSYGKVQGLQPRDGMQYHYYTTLDGAIAKENMEIEEFEIPTKLKELWRTKNYGMYANEKGQMPLAYLASNHTTGGNSGSPVLNANGELVGTNFDRIWEGTMSDIVYDINLCRNITLDVRYTLFIIDKFGGANWLLKEMDILGGKKINTAKK
jgi:Peptidase S46